MSLTERFAELFAGRTDAYGTEDGGCWRVDPASDISTFEVYHDHLTGGSPIGVYPMVECEDENHQTYHEVKWGCVDFDVRSPTKTTGDYESEAEAHVAARNLVLALEAFGITGWIEVTKNRGRHVWVFALQWTPAATMRRALLVACEVAGASVREVNPKQETLAEGQLGNYVRLPYPGAGFGNAVVRTTGGARYIVNEHTFLYGLEDFVAQALASRVHPEVLTAVAELYKPPPEPKLRVRHESGGVVDVECDRALTTRLSGLAYTIFMEGPLDGDRSKALFKLAALCSDSGLDIDEAVSVVTDADQRWGKYTDQGRPDLLLRTIERAYQRAASE